MLSPARHQFAEHGFEHLGRLLSAEQVEALRQASDKPLRHRASPGAYGQIWHNPWPELPLLKKTIVETLAPAAARVLGADQVILFQDHLINKSPGTDAVQWHQDYSYWPLDSPAGLTLWVALEDADLDNGCLHYIPGTHLLGERQPANFFIDAKQSKRPELPDLDAESRRGEAVAVAAGAGDVLAHHPLVWHMSPANRSHRQRHAWSITFLVPDVRWAPEHAPHPFGYQLQTRPGDSLPEDQFPRMP